MNQNLNCWVGLSQEKMAETAAGKSPGARTASKEIGARQKTSPVAPTLRLMLGGPGHGSAVDGASPTTSTGTAL